MPQKGQQAGRAGCLLSALWSEAWTSRCVRLFDKDCFSLRGVIIAAAVWFVKSAFGGFSSRSTGKGSTHSLVRFLRSGLDEFWVALLPGQAGMN
jgi:hypothetical protein